MSIIKKARLSADKRSIDAYGRSIELAIAGYLLDNGSFPTSISELTIEYRGDEVVCSTTSLNSDSSIYLADCTVGGRSVDGYTYGRDNSPSYTAYSVGDEVTYNNVDFYVIKDSGVKEDTVTLLKQTPLTVEEINAYGTGHVNMYIPDYYGYTGRAYEYHGYGSMQYYGNSNCSYNGDDSGCTYDYDASDVKYVVDAWATAKFGDSLKADNFGYEARLLNEDDVQNLGYVFGKNEWDAYCWTRTSDTPSWVYDNQYYRYWTMIKYYYTNKDIWAIANSNYLAQTHVEDWDSSAVRPVITLSKSVISS